MKHCTLFNSRRLGFVGDDKVFNVLSEWERYCERRGRDPNERITNDPQTVREYARYSHNECEMIYDLLLEKIDRQRESMNDLRVTIEQMQKEKPTLQNTVEIKIKQDEYNRQAGEHSGLISALQMVSTRSLNMMQLAKRKG